MGKQGIKLTQVLILMSIILFLASRSGCIRSFEEESYYISRYEHLGRPCRTSFVDFNAIT